MTIELQTLNRGNQADYVFGSELGWGAFDVVRYKATEAIQELFDYDIILARDAEAPPIDIASLIDQPATLRIATEARWRPVHGIVAEAELYEQTDKLILYRVTVVPHLYRSDLRQRCRTFVDKSVKDIVASVLDGSAPGSGQGAALSEMNGAPAAPAEDPSFESFAGPAGSFRWAVEDAARLEEKRAFVVQYNESDLTFVTRLLETEGVSFFFEHADGECVLTMSDRPGHAPLFTRDATHQLVTGVAGTSRNQEIVRYHRLASRVRSGNVVMRDYRWRQSRTKLEAKDSSGGPEGLEHYEFPAGDEDADAPGKGPAKIVAERFAAEQQATQGYSTVRTHEPGYRFTLTDRQHTRDDVELLVTRVETHAVQLMPEHTQLDFEPIGLRRASPPTEPFFEVRYEAVPSELRFRPERKTAKKYIYGVQSARVTSEEVGETELNSDKFGRVRVRFPWDQREPDGTPSSKWVRVAQYWAGPGFGAQYTPRVGHEVLVAFERGNPDRPIIVGRVYNEQNPPPYAEPNTTKSTLKSDSVGTDGASADGFNEFRFEDKSGGEQVFLHAQRNLDEVVRANHSTTVGGDQSNTVGGDQSNTVFGSRRHEVSGTELVHIMGDRTSNFDANEYRQVGGNRMTGIGANDIRFVGADDNLAVGSNQSFRIGANQAFTIGGSRGVEVAAAHNISVGAAEAHSVGATRSLTVGAVHTLSAATHLITTAGLFQSTAANHTFNCAEFTISAGGATLMMSGGFIHLDNGGGCSLTMAGGFLCVESGDYVCNTGGIRKLGSGGATIVTSGATTSLNAGGPLFGTAPIIKWN